MTNSTAAEQFKIISIEMTADRFAQAIPIKFAGEGVSSPIAVEFNIFENITKPYLTGSLVLQDDADIYRKFNLQGTERITVKYSPIDPNIGLSGADTAVEKSFYISNIKKSVKHNDYTSILFINLIEDIGYFDKIQMFSKTYNGKGEEIIEKIIQEKLKRNLDKTYMKESHQKPFRYIVPFISPLTACNNILAKMTTRDGAPYFLFSTVASNDFVLTDLESIMQRDSFNKETPYVYSQGEINNPDGNFKSQVFAAHHFDTTNSEDTLRLAQTGAIAAKYGFVNATTSKVHSDDVNMYSTIEKMIANGSLPPDQKTVQIDPLFKPDPSGSQELVTQYQSKYFYQVSTSPYPLSNNLLGYSEEYQTSDYNLRLIKNSLLKHLTKNVYTLNMAGFAFNTSSKNTTVGSPIEVKVFKNEIIEPGKAATEPTDEKRSGKYMILSKRHMFNITNETHLVSIDVGRVTNPEVIR